MNVETSVLRWFSSVADGTTLTEVSDLEAITQSGLSRALSRLDREVGAPLLARHGRTLRMTRAGAAFKGYVDRALTELDDGLAAVAALASPDTGTVSLAYQLSLGTWLIPRLLAGFRAAHPGVSFELHQIRDEVGAPRLLDESVDVELTTVPATGPDLRWRPLLVEPLQLVVPDGHPLSGRRRVGVAALRDDWFVMLRRTYALRETCDQLCRAAGFEPKVAFEGDDLPTVEGFVAAGLGVAIVPARGPVVHAAPGVRAVELDDPGASRAVGIAWSTRARRLPVAQAFLDYVLGAAKRIGALGTLPS
ncbi:MAG TPA: LysR family transcriptional regulator [Actinomycetes bacterium]|nr:LysR family transcriptional regulator [Actinomycetes bacterium]